MRLHQNLLLLPVILLIWSSVTLAATVPLITRRDQNETVAGNETNPHHNSNSPKTGLGSDPVNVGHGQPHDKHFFEATPENIKASKFGAAYVNWIIGVDKSSAAWRDRLSEPDFFAKDVLEWPDDVNCGIAYNGCDGRPLCDDINERIANRTRARQICYIFDSFHHVSLITAQIHEQSGAAQAAGEAKARELASTFFWQYDPAIQKKCEMFGNLVKAAITALEFSAIAAAPLFTPAAVGSLAAEEEIVVSEAAQIGEAAIIPEVGEAAGVEIGEIETIGSESEVGGVTEPSVGDNPGSENEGGGVDTDGGENPGSEHDDGGVTEPSAGDNPGSENEGESVDTDDGENSGSEHNDGGVTNTDGAGEGRPEPPPNNGGDGAGSTEKGGKRVPGPKMPWGTKPSYDKNGQPKTIGWHRVAEGKTSVVANALVALPVMIAGPALTEAICSAFPNASPGDVDKWTRMLSEKILKAGQDYRSNIDSLLKEMNQGSGFGENGTFVEPFTSIMAETILRGDYVRLTEYERDFFIEETSKLEMTMTTHFINAAISISLKSSMCYLHCTNNVNGSFFEYSETSQFEPEPGVLCQSQCWQNWDQTRQLKMFGLDQLMNEKNHWGTHAVEFLNHSYSHWQWSRYRPDIMFPTVNQLREGTSSNSTSGASVPVCFSPQPIQDYDYHAFNLDKALPCICGDEMGNETVRFFQEANFASWVAAEGGKGVAEACQTSFEIDDTWPAQAFLTFCRLGWHFPVMGDKHDVNATNHGKHHFALGPDVMCEEAKKEAHEIVRRGGSSTDVNCHLCWLSATGKTIKKNQRDYVHHSALDGHNHYNFRRACERQVGKKEVCKLVT